MAATPALRWSLLAEAHPWPDRRPAVPGDWHGWFHGRTRELLADYLLPDARLVLELGTWLGRSTRWILDRAPAARVVSIDHGAEGMAKLPGVEKRPELASRLPVLDETLRRNLWEYRDRLVLITADSLAGISEVYSCGLAPEVCYVDAGHTYSEVLAELELLDGLWPRMPLAGDDFSWGGVREAVTKFAARSGRPYRENGIGWAVDLFTRNRVRGAPRGGGSGRPLRRGFG